MGFSLKKYLSDILLFLLTLIAVFLVWKGAWLWIDGHIFSDLPEVSDEAIRGQFGDKFGAINALFSGCAFAAIILTILLQRKDLTATRNVMSHERFDNTFFQLLKLHTDIAEKLNARGLIGKDAIHGFNEYLKSLDIDFFPFSALSKLTRDQVRVIIDTPNISKEIYPTLSDADVENLLTARALGIGSLNNYLDNNLEMHERKIIHAYTKSCIEYIDKFSHYFRNLYHILKFIDDSELSEKLKQSYAKFLRSQLSEVELVAVFYNSIGQIKLPSREHMELGHPKMARLIQKYDILQNMNPLSIIHPIHLEIFNKNNGKVCNAK